MSIIIELSGGKSFWHVETMMVLTYALRMWFHSVSEIIDLWISSQKLFTQKYYQNTMLESWDGFSEIEYNRNRVQVHKPSKWVAKWTCWGLERYHFGRSWRQDHLQVITQTFFSSWPQKDIRDHKKFLTKLGTLC